MKSAAKSTVNRLGFDGRADIADSAANVGSPWVDTTKPGNHATKPVIRPAGAAFDENRNPIGAGCPRTNHFT